MPSIVPAVRVAASTPYATSVELDLVASGEWPIPPASLDEAPESTDLSAFADVVMDPTDGVTLHQFAHVGSTGTPGIYHATSTDGETWTWDASPILEPGVESWETHTVGVPCVWVESGTWYMLYRGTNASTSSTGLATAAAAAGPWSRYQAAALITGFEAGPGRCIKVGSTYYLFVSNVGSNYGRKVYLYTSTDRVTWTQDTRSPIWTNGRFCNCVWKEGDWYYSLVPHYRDDGQDSGNPADLELWRSSSPTFYPEYRENLGTVLKCGAAGSWSETCLDTPTVLTTDITKTAYPSATDGDMWVFYSGRDDSDYWRTGVVKAPRMPSAQKLLDYYPLDSLRKSAVKVGTWMYDNLAANKNSAYIYLAGDTTSTRKHVVMPFDGSIVALIIRTSASRVGGSVTPLIVNGGGTAITDAPTAVLNSSSVEYSTIDSYVCRLSAGDFIGIALSSSSWDPVGANVTVDVYVDFD